MIIYVVWYQVKWNEFKNKNQREKVWSGIQIVSIMWSGEENDSSWEDVSIFISTGTQSYTNSITGNLITGNTLDKVSTWKQMQKDTAIKMLSGTSIYYGNIKIIEQLGIKYQYALTDSSGIRYIYLGTPSYDFASIARALQGNIYTMATEQEILANKLFWNKVVFINIPEYKDKQVIMLIYTNNGIWLIQSEYAVYHKSKAHIKSLFID